MNQIIHYGVDCTINGWRPSFFSKAYCVEAFGSFINGYLNRTSYLLSPVCLPPISSCFYTLFYLFFGKMRPANDIIDRSKTSNFGREKSLYCNKGKYNIYGNGLVETSRRLLDSPWGRRTYIPLYRERKGGDVGIDIPTSCQPQSSRAVGRSQSSLRPDIVISCRIYSPQTLHSSVRPYILYCRLTHCKVIKQWFILILFKEIY